MKTLITKLHNLMAVTLALCLLPSTFCLAGEDAGAQPFEAGEFAVEYFSAYSTAQSSIGDASINSITQDGDWSHGIGVSYYLTENFGAGIETQADNVCGTLFENVSFTFLARAPIQSIALAPYALGGSSIDIENSALVYWFAGGGVEWRPLSGRESVWNSIGVFADARYIWPNASSGGEGAMFRLGTRFSF